MAWPTAFVKHTHLDEMQVSVPCLHLPYLGPGCIGMYWLYKKVCRNSGQSELLKWKQGKGLIPITSMILFRATSERCVGRCIHKCAGIRVRWCGFLSARLCSGECVLPSVFR